MTTAVCWPRMRSKSSAGPPPSATRRSDLGDLKRWIDVGASARELATLGEFFEEIGQRRVRHGGHCTAGRREPADQPGGLAPRGGGHFRFAISQYHGAIHSPRRIVAQVQLACLLFDERDRSREAGGHDVRGDRRARRNVGDCRGAGGRGWRGRAGVGSGTGRERANQFSARGRSYWGASGGLAIGGFDLGNSPAEYTPAVVGGKTVVLTTTNGTRALLHCRHAEMVLCAALANLSAVCETLATREDVSVLSAGTNDPDLARRLFVAGAIVERLTAGDAWQLNDRGDLGARHVAANGWRYVGSGVGAASRRGAP